MPVGLIYSTYQGLWVVCIKSKGKNGFFHFFDMANFLQICHTFPWKNYLFFVFSWTCSYAYGVNYSQGSRIAPRGESWKAPTELFFVNLIFLVGVSQKYLHKIIWLEATLCEWKKNFKKRINLELPCASLFIVHFKFLPLVKFTISKSED